MGAGRNRSAFRRRIPLALAAVLLPAFFASAASGKTPFEEIVTRDLRLIYLGPTQGFLAPYTVQCFENSMRFHKNGFEFEPRDQVTLMLTDAGDYGNAAVWVNPRSHMLVHLAPTNFVYETGPSNERINFLMNHELTHVISLDQTTGYDRFFRSLFLGKVRETNDHPETMLYGFLTIPRRAAPRWFREGMAVYLETWMSGGLGRAQGPYDEMVFRSMVRDSAHFYDPLGLESEGTKVDFQVGVNSYLYGTRFCSYVSYRYGPEKFMEWIARRPGSRAYFASQYKHLFGEPLTEGWRDWVEWEHEFQRANLDSVRRHPTTPSRDISNLALGSVSRAFVDSTTRTMYAGVYHPGAFAHIAAIPLDGGPIRQVREVKGPSLYVVCSLAWDPEGRQLFYTTDNNEWRDLCALDPATGRSRLLLKDARMGDLAYNRQDKSLWGVRHFNGISTVVRIPPPYTDWNQIFSFPYGRDVYDLDISMDGQWISMSMAEISGRQSLRLMKLASLASHDTTSRTLFDFGSSIPTSFVFSPDGRFLYGSSYYTGVSNIFRYDLQADSMDIVSNCETGFFRPIPMSGDSLIIFRYSGQGFVPAWIEAKPLTDVSAITFFGQQIVEKYPELKTWKVPSPRSVNLDSVIVRQGPYRPLRNVRLLSAYPVVEGYKDGAAVGMDFVFEDPFLVHSLSLTGSYSPGGDLAELERWHGALDYRFRSWAVKMRHNPASFYDLFGPTKVSRKGDMGSVEWRKSIIRDKPRAMDLSAGVEGWTGLEYLPNAQNIAVESGFERLWTPSIELTDKNARQSIGGVDPEKGYQWHLASWLNQVRFGRGDATDWRSFPFVEAGLDVGTPLPVRNASLWLRTAGGWSPGDRNDPFANFFFGGFGNNWVDYQEPKRYRDFYSLPGVGLNEVAGTNAVRGQVDLNLSPLRFERLGTPGFYGSFVRTSLFGTALVTNVDLESSRREVYDLGVQMDLRFQVLTQQTFTLSGGYARAFEKAFVPRDEWMVSLKIL